MNLFSFSVRSVLAFMPSTGVGFQIEYPAITLHAVSRGESGPSIYCQLDEGYGQANGGPSANEDEDSEMRELTIVPKNSDSCMVSFIPTFHSYLIRFFFSSGAHF
jgi:chloride channel, nucleotide-sensitive, 1A